MFKVSILTIGDEICIGQITNTNASWIANELTKTGADVLQHSSIPDNKDVMISELERLINVSDFLIITGGLGPTHDDITKPVLTEYFDDELMLHKPTLNYLKMFFSKRGYELTERNKAQAMLPSKCRVLKNKVGTAPGMLFEKEGKFIVSLPGVPSEMKYIIKNSILTLIKDQIIKRKENVSIYKIIHTSGVPEAKLADLIGNPEDFLKGASLAFLPSYRGVKLRIGVRAVSIEKGNDEITRIQNIIEDKAGKYIVSTGNTGLLEMTAKKLTDSKKTIAVAESCTGGLLGGALTEISGSSVYFSGGIIAYSNEIKINEIGVNRETIESEGAVSKQTAEEMAAKIREKFNADIGVSITGIAGPTGGNEDKPVGTVFIGIADRNSVIAYKFIFGEERGPNRERSVGMALTLILKKLNETDY